MQDQNLGPNMDNNASQENFHPQTGGPVGPQATGPRPQSAQARGPVGPQAAGPGPQASNGLDFNKILFIIKGWFSRRPMDNFLVSFTGLESFICLLLSVISMTFFFGIGFSSALNALGPLGDMGYYVDAVKGVLVFISLIFCAIYMGFVWLSLFGVSKVYKMQIRERGAIFQNIGIASTILIMSSLLATILSFIIPIVGLLTYALGFHAFWAALYTGMQKKLTPATSSPFWGMMLARILSLLATYFVLSLLISSILGQATRSMQNYMPGGFPF